eukprot:11971516-Alexandrium_andersonii.AAC.1
MAMRQRPVARDSDVPTNACRTEAKARDSRPIHQASPPSLMRARRPVRTPSRKKGPGPVTQGQPSA